MILIKIEVSATVNHPPVYPPPMILWAASLESVLPFIWCPAGCEFIPDETISNRYPPSTNHSVITRTTTTQTHPSGHLRAMWRVSFTLVSFQPQGWISMKITYWWSHSEYQNSESVGSDWNALIDFGLLEIVKVDILISEYFKAFLNIKLQFCK